MKFQSTRIQNIIIIYSVLHVFQISREQRRGKYYKTTNIMLDHPRKKIMCWIRPEFPGIRRHSILINIYHNNIPIKYGYNIRVILLLCTYTSIRCRRKCSFFPPFTRPTCRDTFLFFSFFFFIAKL